MIHGIELRGRTFTPPNSSCVRVFDVMGDMDPAFHHDQGAVAQDLGHFAQRGAVHIALVAPQGFYRD